MLKAETKTRREVEADAEMRTGTGADAETGTEADTDAKSGRVKVPTERPGVAETKNKAGMAQRRRMKSRFIDESLIC